MALTRKMLKAMSIEDEKIDEIIEAHAETVTALKDERDTMKAQADKVSELQKALDEANEKLESFDNDEFKAKFESEHQAFEAFKADIEAEKQKAEKTKLYRALLEESGIDSKRIESILKVSDIDGLAVSEGALTEREALAEQVKKDWSDFIVSSGTNGANVDTPPNTSGNESDLSKLSMAEYVKARKSNI